MIGQLRERSPFASCRALTVSDVQKASSSFSARAIAAVTQESIPPETRQTAKDEGSRTPADSDSAIGSARISLLPPIFYPSALFLDAARFRPPNVFMHLQLHAEGQATFGNPICQFLQVDLPPG